MTKWVIGFVSSYKSFVHTLPTPSLSHTLLHDLGKNLDPTPSLYPQDTDPTTTLSTVFNRGRPMSGRETLVRCQSYSQNRAPPPPFNILQDTGSTRLENRRRGTTVYRRRIKLGIYSIESTYSPRFTSPFPSSPLCRYSPPVVLSPGRH